MLEFELITWKVVYILDRNSEDKRGIAYTFTC